jgi:hypothetical protein
MENFKIALILGTGREGANSQKIFDFVLQEAKNFGFDVYGIKVKDWLDKPYTGGMSEE